MKIFKIMFHDTDANMFIGQDLPQINSFYEELKNPSFKSELIEAAFLDSVHLVAKNVFKYLKNEAKNETKI